MSFPSEIERRKAKVEEMKGGLERRTLVDGAQLELRDDTDEFVASGYAATFAPPYDMGTFRERVSPKAFDRTLKERPDVTFWVDHGRSLSGLPLARTRSKGGGPGSLTLGTDSHGLWFRAQLDREDPDAQALVRAIRSGRIWQSSFAFRCNADSFDDSTNTRTLLDVTLHGGDVSAVAMPANPATSVDARSRRSARSTLDLSAIRDRERLMFMKRGFTPARELPAREPTARTVEDRLRIEALRHGCHG